MRFDDLISSWRRSPAALCHCRAGYAEFRERCPWWLPRPWETEGPNNVRTMDHVFRQVERVLDQPGEGSRSATYDPSLGYPTSARYKIDGNGIVDDFWSFWVKNFTILDK